MPFRGCSNDNIGGRLRRPELALKKAQTSVVIGGVVDNGEQFIAVVVDTGDNIFPGVVDTGQK